MGTGNNRLPVLAAEIQRAHEAARQHAGAALAHAIEAGERLIEAKDKIKHGGWIAWLGDNTDLPDRTARVYMRLARHKDVIDIKSATVADLTIRGAVAEITEPKWPEKLSEQVKAIELLPVHGHIRIGVREDAAGWDEVWISPSQHDAFFFVNHIWTSRRGGGSSLVGSRRPVRGDFVRDIVSLHLSLNFVGVVWSDRLSPPWPFNILLFTDADANAYVNNLTPADAEDRAELFDVARSVPPLGPLCALVFADDDGAEARP